MVVQLSTEYGTLPGLVGTDPEFYGRLIATGNNEAFLAGSYESWRQGMSLPLRDATAIVAALLAKLPPYGGGDCLNDEDAYVIGRLLRNESGDICVAWRSCRIIGDAAILTLSSNTDGTAAASPAR